MENCRSSSSITDIFRFKPREEGLESGWVSSTGEGNEESNPRPRISGADSLRRWVPTWEVRDQNLAEWEDDMGDPGV